MTQREAPVLRKLIAANELLAVAVWVALIAFGKAPALHDASGLVQLGREILFLGAAVAGGVLLWRDDVRGYRLSIAVQACQVLRLASSHLTLLVSSGLRLTVDYSPFIPKNAGRTNVMAGFAGVELELARVAPLSLGVNVVAVLCLVWLLRNVRAAETRAGRGGIPAVAFAVAPVIVGLGLSYLLSPPPFVVFDEGDRGDAGYCDASFGAREGSGELTLAGPGSDKLPVVTGRGSSGLRCGLLEWRAPGPAARWFLFVASPSWSTLDASPFDALTLTVNGPAAIDAASLPAIGLQSASNARTATVSLAAFLPRGIDADPATWQRVTIPIVAFQPYGAFRLSEFKAIWFCQGAADDTRRTIWFDEVRLIRR